MRQMMKIGESKEESPLILIIEDDEEVKANLNEGLSLLGYRTRHAGDGRSGVEKAWEMKPDAVVIDAGMLGMSGWETAALIRESPGLRSVPVVFLSGSSEARGRYFENPPFNSSFVPKPFNLRFLDSLLRAFIRLRKGFGGDGMDLPKTWDGKSGPRHEIAPETLN
jgi:CheY-like chemotaxis protein